MGERTVVRGLPGAAGRAVGPCTVFANLARVGKSEFGRDVGLRHSKTYIAESAIDSELSRLRSAVERAQHDLTAALAGLGSILGEQRAILEAYFLMLDDPMFHGKIRQHITVGRLCAEWAVSEAAGELRAAFARFDGADPASAHLAERKQDVDFVADKLLRSLGGGQAMPLLQTPSVVVATDLSPAELAQLDRKLVLALVVERGTKTSHTSILARALGMPTVVGAHGATSTFRTGDLLLVDGREGLVIANPSQEDRDDARGRSALYATPAPVSPHGRGALEDLPALAATIQLPGELEDVFRYGGTDVALCRTEFLFLNRRTIPSEQDQYAVYASLARAMNGGSIAIRTFDVGGDKPSTFVDLPHESNPALGLRALRIGLREPGLLAAQVRAILRASVHGDVRLLLPMVTTLAEVRAVKHLMVEAAREVGAPLVPLGIMVEVPAAAVLADLFAKEVDFFSVGVNDLVQYTLAVDRTSLPLAELASPLDPAVLRLLALTCHAARAHTIPVSICGAATADPVAAVVYAGLGAGTLSMNARALPVVREALRRVGKSSAERLAAHALDLRTAAEVESYLARELEPRLGALLLERA